MFEFIFSYKISFSVCRLFLNIIYVCNYTISYIETKEEIIQSIVS